MVDVSLARLGSLIFSLFEKIPCFTTSLYYPVTCWQPIIYEYIPISGLKETLLKLPIMKIHTY
jgi:hypothetical protein